MGDFMNRIKLKRIASQIVREVSDILNNVARDKIMHTITITGCDVSNDLSFAKVYVTVLADDKRYVKTHEIHSEWSTETWNINRSLPL